MTSRREPLSETELKPCPFCGKMHPLNGMKAVVLECQSESEMEYWVHVDDWNAAYCWKLIEGLKQRLSGYENGNNLGPPTFDDEEKSELRAKIEQQAAQIQKLRNALEKTHYELNVIRARDGVPYRYDGHKSDVDPEYFSSVVDEAAEVLKQFPRPEVMP